MPRNGARARHSPFGSPPSAAHPTRRRRRRRNGSAPSRAYARRRRCPSAPGPRPAPDGRRSPGTAPSTAAGRSRVGGLDPARAADRRRRDQHDLAVPEGHRALLREVDRVALGAGAERIAVDLVAEQDADRPAREPRGRVGADDGQVPAREALVQDLVRAVPRLRVGDLAHEARRVARHRREAVLRPGLGVPLGRHHHHDRRRVLVDVVADAVAQGLRLAHLTARHHHHALDAPVGDRVHDAALVLGAAGTPLAGLGARLRAQPAVWSAQSLIESSGGGFRIESDLRAAVASRSGPVRISGDDRRRGELVERLADRFADLVADPGNRRLLVAERRQPVGQHQQPGAQPGQHRRPGGLDRLGRQQSPRRPSASISAMSALALIRRARSAPKSGAPACARTASRAGRRRSRGPRRRGRTVRARPSGSPPRGSAAGPAAR